MLDDDDDDDDDEAEDGPTDDEVREALLALKTDDEPSLRHVLCLASAALDYEVELLPPEVGPAIEAVYALDRDVANGGLDQFVWNHGVELSRGTAAALRAVGALENPDVIDRLAATLAARQAEVSPEAVRADPVAHFLAFRRAVRGPEFGIPDHREEAAEVILEFVLERAEALPDPDAALPRRAAQ